VATMSAMTPRFIRMSGGPAPGSTGGAGEPVLTQTLVDRFLSSPQRVDVGMIGGKAGRHLGTLGNGPVAGDQDIDVPGSLTQPVECRLIGAHLIGAARVEERDQDVGEHVAGEQDATVREDDRSVADGVRLMLDDPARHGSPSAGSGVRSPISSINPPSASRSS
jgi:hypothetical protein